MNEPIQIITWQCPHCLSEYDDYEEALVCSRHPRVAPRYKVGDTVYVPLRYATKDGKRLAQVTVTQILDKVSTPFHSPSTDDDYHQPLYVLSRTVPVSDGVRIGEPPRGWDKYLGEDYRNSYRPAPQYWLYQMGDKLESFLDEGVVTPDLVTTDF